MSVSFKVARRRLADIIEPRSWGTGTTTSAGTTTTVVSTDFKMVSGDTRGLDAGWVYFGTGTLAGQCRPIQIGGLDIDTGTITVANPFTTTTPDATEFEVHLRYPVKRCPGTPTVAGYLEIFNDAMTRLWGWDDLTVVSVDNQTEYPIPITTYPFLEETERVIDVLDPEGTDGVRHSTSQTWSIHDDAELPVIVLSDGYSAATTPWYLRVARPSWTRIKVAGVTWTEVTQAALNVGQAGFAIDTDETHARMRDLLAMGITESMNHLGMKQPSMEANEWEARRLYWANVAGQCKFRRLPRRNISRQGMKPVMVGGGIMGRGSNGGSFWRNL